MRVIVAIAIAFAVGYAAGQSGVDKTTGNAVDTLVVYRTHLDTAYRSDTIRLWRAKMVYDTARVTDTVMRNDTVFVPRLIADSAVVACVMSLATCERRVAMSDSVAAFWRDSVGNIPTPRPASKLVALATLVWLVVQALAR